MGMMMMMMIIATMTTVERRKRRRKRNGGFYAKGNVGSKMGRAVERAGKFNVAFLIVETNLFTKGLRVTWMRMMMKAWKRDELDFWVECWAKRRRKRKRNHPLTCI